MQLMRMQSFAGICLNFQVPQMCTQASIVIRAVRTVRTTAPGTLVNMGLGAGHEL